MIYTVTFAPAIDAYYYADNVILGATNRAKEHYLIPGGKGINVSRMLKILGHQSVALGFIGGLTDELLEKLLKEYEINTNFVHTKFDTRINVKINDKLETEINAPHPTYNLKDIKTLFKQLETLKSDDVLIISGLMPDDIDNNLLDKTFKKLNENKVRFIVDSNRSSLLKLLPYKPFLVKPNKKELEDFFLAKINNKKDLISYAKKLLNLGALNVIVSLGKDGAIFINDKLNIKLNAPKIKLVSSIGSGDAMVAAFIDAYIRSKSYQSSFIHSVIVGSISCMYKDYPNKKVIDKLKIDYYNKYKDKGVF